MADKRVFHLVHDQARRGAMAHVADAPAGYVVTVQEPTRNLEQNAALHARIGEISERAEWCGRKWDIETWKRLLVAAWSRAVGEQTMVLPALDGHGVDIVFRRTSKMTQREMSGLIEFINAWAAENISEEAA